MLKLLADENIEGAITQGLRRRKPAIDLVRVQEIAHAGKKDPIILEWAAQNGRILLTHDKHTIPGFAYDRLKVELPMPGIFVLDPSAPFEQVIEAILLLEECSVEDEWQNQVIYIP